MPILLKCTCGKALRTPDELAGKKVRCPGCLTVRDVPVPILSPDPLPLPSPVVKGVDEEDLPMVLPVKKVRNEDADTYVMADVPETPRRRDDFEEDERLRRRLSKPSWRERERDR